MGNGYRGCGPHGVIGYREYGVQGYGHMGQKGTGVWVQDTWAMGTEGGGNRVQGVWGTGVWAYGPIGYRGMQDMGHMGNSYRGMGHTRSCVPLDPTLIPSQ